MIDDARSGEDGMSAGARAPGVPSASLDQKDEKVLKLALLRRAKLEEELAAIDIFIKQLHLLSETPHLYHEKVELPVIATGKTPKWKREAFAGRKPDDIPS